MRKPLILCLILLAAGVSAGSVYDVTIGTNGTVELGNLQGGQELIVTLRMHNESDEGFPIRHISTSCGCTTPRQGIESIPAGEYADLDITFRAPAHRGEKTSRIVFLSNANNRDPWIVSLHAGISMLIELDPVRVDFGTLTLGTDPNSISASVEIHNNSDNPVTLVSVSSEDDAVRAAIEGRTVIAPHTAAAIELHLAPLTEVGSFDSEILFHFEEEQIPDQRIHAIAEIEGNVTANPSRLWFGSLRAGDTREREVRILSSGEEDFSVTAARIDQPGFTTEITQPEPNVFRVAVNLDTTQEGVELGPFVTELMLETNDPYQPEVLLNVMGTVRP